MARTVALPEQVKTTTCPGLVMCRAEHLSPELRDPVLGPHGGWVLLHAPSGLWTGLSGPHRHVRAVARELGRSDIDWTLPFDVLQETQQEHINAVAAAAVRAVNSALAGGER